MGPLTTTAAHPLVMAIGIGLLVGLLVLAFVAGWRSDRSAMIDGLTILVGVGVLVFGVFAFATWAWCGQVFASC